MLAGLPEIFVRPWGFGGSPALQSVSLGSSQNFRIAGWGRLRVLSLCVGWSAENICSTLGLRGSPALQIWASGTRAPTWRPERHRGRSLQTGIPVRVQSIVSPGINHKDIPKVWITVHFDRKPLIDEHLLNLATGSIAFVELDD